MLFKNTASVKTRNELHLEGIILSDEKVDEVVKHYEIFEKEFLLELKEKMLFATLCTRSPLTNPVAFVCFEKTQRESWVSYRGILLKSQETLPIYYSADSSVPSDSLTNQYSKHEIDFTYDFNKVIRYLNINNYEYYNQLIV